MDNKLSSFKNKTGEDEVISKLCLRVSSWFEPSTILDVGGGSGRIASDLAQSETHPSVLSVDPSEKAFCNVDTSVITLRNKIENLRIAENVDGAIMSHVLGHISVDKRYDVVHRIFEKSSNFGMIITNALVKDFKKIQREVWEYTSSHKYFVSIEDIIRKREKGWAYWVGKFKVNAKLKSDKELVNLINMFSPNEVREDVINNTNIASLVKRDNFYLIEIPQFILLYTKKKCGPGIGLSKIVSPTSMGGYELHGKLWNNTNFVA